MLLCVCRTTGPNQQWRRDNFSMESVTVGESQVLRSSNTSSSSQWRAHQSELICAERAESEVDYVCIHVSARHVDHHVTIQRLLASHGEHGLRSPGFASGTLPLCFQWRLLCAIMSLVGGDMLFPLRKQLHIHKMHTLEIPITKVNNPWWS